MPRQKRRLPLKRSNDDLSVRDARDAAPTEGRLHPSMTRWGMRGMEDLTVEELTRLHQKLDEWIRQRAHDPERLRRRPWVMKPKRPIRHEGRCRRVSHGGRGEETL
jgi:hypothetical protein